MSELIDTLRDSDLHKALGDESISAICASAADRIAELEAALRRITPAYRAACAKLQGQPGDDEFWGDDASILTECEKLIGN